MRCLEYIRLNFGSIVPGYGHLPIRLVALRHHHANNVYPALALIPGPYPDLTSQEIFGLGLQIDTWVAAETLEVLVMRSREVQHQLRKSFRRKVLCEATGLPTCGEPRVGTHVQMGPLKGPAGLLGRTRR